MTFREWRQHVATDQHAFIWQAGVLGFGLLFGLGMAVAVWFVHDWANHPVWSNLLKSLGFLAIGPFAGYAWGFLMWHLRGFWSAPHRQAAKPRHEQEAAP